MGGLSQWTSTPLLLLGAAIVIGFALTQFAGGPSPVAEAEASFIKGIYSTAEGCRTLDARSEKKLEDVPQADRPVVLDRRGLVGRSFSCGFARVDRVAGRKAYVATLMCDDARGAQIEHMSLIPEGDRAVVIRGGRLSEPVRYERCRINK
ncbi:MAG: hypothetical protein AAFQ42_04120 [Pseudomonadota bacterium]